jgi:uncharacterized protein (UPF0335 family)
MNPILNLKSRMKSAAFAGLNHGQQLVFLGVAQGENMLITGGGGVGKSHLIRFLADSIKNLVLTASTGIAGINIEGQTIDSFMGFSSTTKTILKARQMDDAIRKRLQAVTVLLIDETSMIRADALDLIDARFQSAKQNNLPFGGVQIIVVGDFCQLPPVLTDKPCEDFYRRMYGERLFAFEANCWERAGFVPYVLTDYVRQGDEETRRNLRNLRMGRKIREAIDFINDSAAGYVGEETLNICKTNAKANAINESYFSKVLGATLTSKGVTEGVFPTKSYPVDYIVRLKKGCRVLLSANNPDAGYLNGDLGVIVSFYESSVVVLLDRGIEVKVTSHQWKNYGYEQAGGELMKEPIGTYTQFPIKLGYAITGHKSQGMTLESAVVDFSGSFNAYGLAYVVLSRVKSLNNLKLTTKIRVKDIMTSNKAADFTFKVSMEALSRREQDTYKLSELAA